jgi:hypothetical protein
VIGALQNALEQAVRLGHQWVGPEHVVLALLDERHPSPTRSKLFELGFTSRSYEDRFLASLLACDPPIRSPIAVGPSASPAPIFYAIDGWVNGYAAASGEPASDETVLLALRALRPDVVGVAAPARALRRIDVPPAQLDDVQRGLRDVGLLVGCNTDAENDRAWVIIDDSADDAAARAARIMAVTHSPSGEAGVEAM